MSNKIVLKKSSVAGRTPTTSDLEYGEVALNYNDGRLYYKSSENAIEAFTSIQATQEPMGFEDRSGSTISFNNSTRTFTVTPVSSSFTVWLRGLKKKFTSSQTVVVPDTTGLYYIYFDSTGVLQHQSAFFDLETQTPVAYVYWNATQGYASFVADERHGIVMDWATHEYLHRTRGAVIASGFGASNYVIEGNGSLDSHMQLDLDGGTFFDEDLEITITHSNSPSAIFEQDLKGPAKIPMFYLDGAGEWKIDTPTDFPLKQGTARPQYNVNNSGTWSTADIDNLNYGVTWILATNNINYPIIGIIGQNYSDSEGQAEARTFSDLVLTGFPIVEFRPLYKIIYRCSNAYTNTPHARLQSIWDLRTLQQASIAQAVLTDHGGLSGLDDDDHLQYVHTSNARTITANHSFTGSSVTAVTQAANTSNTTIATTEFAVTEALNKAVAMAIALG